MKKNERAVVLCTDKLGVFFGYTDKPFNRNKMVLSRCRMAVEWVAHGIGDLAVGGPQEGSRITPAVSKWLLVDLHSEMLCSEEAIAGWEADPWAK